jgi:hypothetical protein
VERRKKLWIVVAIVVLVPGSIVALWLASPLFISKTVEEEFPLAAKATVPENMAREEVENIFAGMAKVQQEMKEEMPVAVDVKTGALRDADSFHKGSGQATIYQLPRGNYFLRLADLKVTNGPALHVILSSHPDPQSRDDVKGYIDLGGLKGNLGNQNYDIPAGIDLAAQRSVVIYCKPFQVIFSVSPLQDVRK